MLYNSGMQKSISEQLETDTQRSGVSISETADLLGNHTQQLSFQRMVRNTKKTSGEQQLCR